MANGPALSTAKGGEVYVRSEFRDSCTMLHVLHANQFEGEIFDPAFTGKTEENFYRGAPPQWLNFYISEQAESLGTAFIKRDGYEKLREQIRKKRTFPGISAVKLTHQPGCGGTTMAMQVMWDLRKSFRCAVLTGSTSDMAKVAKEVVQLFTAGSRNNQNTVLLLVNEKKILEDLEINIMMTVAEQKIVTRMPVVIFLSCVRNNAPQQSDHVVLKNTLSDNEKEKFDKKKEELQKRYKDKCEQFHGFNIMQSNFSQDYVREACAALENCKKTNQSLKLTAFLCLLNAYVPGSYLLESQCLDFLRHEDYDDLSLEDQMQPFSHLIITFQEDGRAEKKVHMAHTMIAQYCTELLAKAGVTRSDTTRNFVNSFCRDPIPLWLLGFVKEMLTKREMKQEVDQVNSTDIKQKKFSRLILDIEMMEGKEQCATVLEVASNTFGQNPNFPQALARFYYIELKDYNQAEMWAQRAIERDPQNSFVADTLGQVHKNHLMNNEVSEPRDILRLAKKAIKAFEDEEKLAEDEDGPDMKEHGNIKVSPFYNFRGQLGYLQVCKTLHKKLVSQNETWEKVLTKKVSMGSVLELLGDNKLQRFNDLILSLQDDIERKCMFLEKFQTYSKPKMEKDDPEYISEDTSECYQKYVGDTTAKQLIQMFQDRNLDDQSVEVLSFLVKQYTQSELEDISTKCREMCPSADSEAALVNNILTLFIGKMPSSKKDPPELHMFSLLWYWAGNQGQCDYDLSELTQQMYKSYENTYKKYFRNRYLLPVFFIGKGEGVKRIVHRNVIEKHLKVIEADWSNNWKKEEIFRNPAVQELLLRLDGEVRNDKVYTRVGGKEIEIDANVRNKIWKPRSVTFYLGFTIRGPVAFDIQSKTADTGLLKLRMANGPALSTAKGGEVYVRSEFRDSCTMLHVLHANQFEGENFDPALTGKTEENFYRGAPPQWLNFYISEQAESLGTAFIKRDGHEKLREQIQKKRTFPGISTVKLTHQPGCGGTTMAMQVMWDLRKSFRCAVLTGSTSDMAKVAKEVVQLFTAGSRNNQNTVLLLVNEKKILEDLEINIMMTVAEQKIVTRMPVVIFLSCVRNNAPQQSDHVVLKNTLSDNEKENFDKKKEELQKRYKDKCEQFHGFNIMQSNFSQDYVREACAALENSKKTNKPRKTQLAAFLCLLNAYVPGSYLLESQCLDFLGHEDYDDLSLEDQTQPFSHLIITFQEDGRAEKKVHMAHTMIAQYCTELLAKAGVTRSDTTRNFLNSFCRDPIPLWLLGFVKEMLTKREMKQEVDQVNSTDIKQKKFSRLILDIEMMEGKEQCATVLEVASNTFGQNPFFPQALARFYYIELKDYNQAEMWAQRAIERDPQNSFVADTLGQVHKNHLMNNEVSEPRDILRLAKKAIKAFEDEEKLAEDEDGPDMKKHGNIKVSPFYNFRGQFGYLQVCKTLHKKLVSQNETWEKVLTKKVSMGSVLELLGDNKLQRFNDLILSLQDDIERKCMFLEKFQTYSKPKMEKDDPEYISKDTSECYQKYVDNTTAKQLIQMFQDRNLDDQSVEVLSFLVKQYTQSELEDISTKCREMCPSADSEAALVNNILTLFIGKMPSSKKDPPELHMFSLLWYWAGNQGQCDYDLSELTQQMYKSYENTYKKYFRNRYLLPVFFIGKGEGVKRIVHRNVIEKHLKVIEADWSDNWKKEEIFRNPAVQELLLRLDGEVRNYKVYTRVGGKEIKIDANVRNSLWKPRSVAFYLGFTIRGPVAFDIQSKTADTDHSVMDLSGTALTNDVKDTKDNEGH
ncbi:uncharacterized protein LOC143416453 [Maylandia zebra]|uniref:uncharacterized protein LOC143416453 n=1 Tax=Maylandia zebra TaxID=106582 RepID=UPI00403C3E47